MCGRLTTHVLDTALGRPAPGVALTLHAADSGKLLAEAVTNADGRCDGPLLEGSALQAGRYELRFFLAAYFARHHPGLPDPPFLDVISLNVGIADPAAHYHVPLLISPFGYSTYRGS
jgi:5-hydroxyisourate hydrolase